ncbi:MAG: chorismate synthase [Ruminococcaceae bacterium]|nr:chorismate synthase [Oscillospiraceae bacterium]
MASVFGNNIKISIFGQSHSSAIGVTIDGLPAGFKIDMDELAAFLARRAPGNSQYATPRKEDDLPEFLSGLVDGVTCGAPLTAIIRNTNTRPDDYRNLAEVPRPGHADFTAQIKYKGFQDPTGGGHFSGRLTAPLCIAGGICLQLLKARGIFIGAHICKIGSVSDISYDPCNVSVQDFKASQGKELPVIDSAAETAMSELILTQKSIGNSIGGAIECAVIGMPTGIGEPMFDGLENRISQSIFAIPAIKGIEFGCGFGVTEMTGSENNDDFYVDDNGVIKTATNNHGGILGGISSGMPIIFRVAVKPTPSIGIEQNSVNIPTKQNTKLIVKGRHDPCILPRAVPCVEAACAIAILDMII